MTHSVIFFVFFGTAFVPSTSQMAQVIKEANRHLAQEDVRLRFVMSAVRHMPVGSVTPPRRRGRFAFDCGVLLQQVPVPISRRTLHIAFLAGQGRVSMYGGVGGCADVGGGRAVALIKKGGDWNSFMHEAGHLIGVHHPENGGRCDGHFRPDRPIAPNVRDCVNAAW